MYSRHSSSAFHDVSVSGPILGVASERDLRHAKVVGDQKLHEMARFTVQT
jgi:hypothetical protein